MNPAQGQGTGGSRVRDVAGRWLPWVCLGALLVVLRPTPEPLDIPLYEVGQVADRTIIAPFPFQVTKSRADLERERLQAANEEPAVFRFNPSTAQNAMARVARLAQEDPAEVMPGLSEATSRVLRSPSDRQQVVTAVRDLVAALLSGWICAPGITPHQAGFVVVMPDQSERSLPPDSLTTLDKALSLLSSLARARFPEQELLARATYEIGSQLIGPTVVFDPVATELRRAAAMERVPQVVGTVLAGEVIVEAHYRVTQADIDELRSLREAYAAKVAAAGSASRIGPLVGHVLWVCFFLLLVAASLRSLSPQVLKARSETTLVTVLLGVLALVSFATRWWLRLPASAIPLPAFAILATVFFDAKVGFWFTVMGLLVAASYLRFELSGLVGPLSGALVAVFWIRRLRQRRDFFLATLWVSLAMVGGSVSLGLVSGASAAALGRTAALSAGNAVACTILVVAAFPLLETVFHRTTDLRLLELLDMNHILLRQLALEAPGTYHHSIIVGNMAEAVCDAIGANGLLARVGAYYHDIGKLTKPHYFAENQLGGENPHARLSPKMSALVIASHVREGIRLAMKEGLPPSIIDFIAQHHGTTQISFFYQKMKEQNPDAKIDPEDFSYPGPRPKSRETAVVMLADAAEGACRSLENPTPARIRQVVQRVIHERLTTGQLDESTLTFRDLERVREIFVAVLVGAHHHRVRYPDAGATSKESS